ADPDPLPASGSAFAGSVFAALPLAVRESPEPAASLPAEPEPPISADSDAENPPAEPFVGPDVSVSFGSAPPSCLHPANSAAQTTRARSIGVMIAPKNRRSLRSRKNDASDDSLESSLAGKVAPGTR